MTEWGCVAVAIDARRKELGLTPQQLAKSAGLSLTAVKNIIGDVKPGYAEATQYALCRALGWTPDSIGRIKDGGEPELDIAALARQAATVIRTPEQMALYDHLLAEQRARLEAQRMDNSHDNGATRV